ncbi:ABC-2 transporter permease [Clostridium botulinum]|uniref:ABC-2 transporter permease n=1 Tax=Clostridium botulinum TaxID=1491 RepID=A0A6B4U2K9_CLOBO|nr:ABC-2 transporter permease [Clostridium botulinum]NFD83512.1 ABC-2 transporter permease [Clostridium botulinum]NFE08142.1 ABC-2 transporter permease [Clostridium botulinum]NFE33234.1 ABC-2 transporter permease [Clostridium botulinum]NFE47827.1 ABC-2 transporter permease [Clostridium botulinum]
MLISLVKKDILLVKKYMLIMMIIAIAIPIFIMWRIPEFLGFSAFLISTIFAEFMLYQYVSMAELKYPKADALLCATPYPRHSIVVARYIFLLLIFTYSILAYSIVALILPGIKFLSLSNVLAVMLISAILFGVYTPIQYKLGYEKTKYFFSIVIVGTPFLLPTLAKLRILLDFSWLSSTPSFLWNLIMIAIIILVLSVSVITSIKIYEKKELY